jgi:predicted aldo/keto reductase-like oxidoreductase
MPYLGEHIPKLGFGLMRLPRKEGKIDVEQVKEMVDLFLEAGFTYFDTAWAYEGSEEAIRQALVERYPRERFQLATKNAAWIGCKTRAEAAEQLQTSLRRTGAEYFDFYLLHNLGEGRTKAFDDLDLWSWVLEKKREGLVRHVGFSFHSTPEELEELLIRHPEMEFVQLQINYADWESPTIQARSCYEVARRHNKPVIVMEPVKGGMLATPPKGVEEILRTAEPAASAASWGVRFAASLEGVLTVLSGMSSVEQMRDNLSYMREFTGLTLAQQKVLERARDALEEIPLIPCTSCDYCGKVCPQNVGISGSFTAHNLLKLYGNREAARAQEKWLVGGHGKASATACIQCGACEAACPQHIPIRAQLEEVCRALLEGPRGAEA